MSYNVSERLSLIVVTVVFTVKKIPLACVHFNAMVCGLLYPPELTM